MANLEVHEADGFAPRHEEVEAGLGDAIEFAEALDDAGGVSADRIHGLDEGDEEEDAEDDDDDQKQHCRVHGNAFPAEVRGDLEVGINMRGEDQKQALWQYARQ
jgi:hypothetical protein